MERITDEELEHLRQQLQPLIGTSFPSLRLPVVALEAFEPSQIGTIVGALMDALIPHLPDMPEIGLLKHEGILGEREGYPDYKHVPTGKRLELKLLYVDNPDLKMKKPPTPREPSARLTQKVTCKNVVPATDAMLLIAYRMEPLPDHPDAASPRIIALDVFSMIELIEARDRRMEQGGGRWFGNYETPTVLSRRGKKKWDQKLPLDTSSYGRKESEGKDYNEDTNFGKLKRIPHPELQAFLKKYRLNVTKQKSPTLPQAIQDVGKILEQLEDET